MMIPFPLSPHFPVVFLLRIMESFKNCYFHSAFDLNLEPFCFKSRYLILILVVLKVLILKLKCMKKLVLFNFWCHCVIEADMGCV